MDLVTDEGEALIAYAAELRFRSLALAYTSLLQHRAGQTRTTASLRKAMPVLVDERKLTWASRALGARGSWSAEGDGTKETLYSGEAGSVEWSCVMPHARAEVEVDGGRIVRGLGYAEELRMTIAPWDLPLEELRWGRFTADGASVVWIDWRGPHNKTIILKHGARVEGQVKDRLVEMATDEAKVVLGNGSVLRDGPIRSTSLAAIAELHAILPAKLLGAVEHKECAPATLEQPFAPKVTGWAIAETVTWKPAAAATASET
jgi:hypothetical protein